MNLKSNKAKGILLILESIGSDGKFGYDRYSWGSTDTQEEVQWLVGARLVRERERIGSLSFVGFTRFYHQLKTLNYTHRDMVKLTVHELRTLRKELIQKDDKGKQV